MDTPPPPVSQSTPRNIYAFGLTSFLNDTASEMAYWVMPAFLASIGAGSAEVGIILSVAGEVTFLSQLFSGFLADKNFHRQALLGLGYILDNAVYAMLALDS